MASTMSGMQTSAPTSVRAQAPFRAAGKAMPRRQRMIVVKASQVGHGAHTARDAAIERSG